jgi:hypothetical protein
MHIKNRLFVFATLAALSAGTAGATTITNITLLGGSPPVTINSSLTNWKANLQGNYYEVPAFSNYLPSPTSGSLSLPVTVPAAGNFVFSGLGLNVPSSNYPVQTGTRTAAVQVLEGPVITITPPTSFANNAFFLFLSSTDGSALTLTLSDGESIPLTPTLTSSGSVGVGLSLSQSVTLLTISAASGQQAVLWDFYYGTSNQAQDTTGGTPTAEGSTGLLIGLGLVTFGAGRKLFSAAAV